MGDILLLHDSLSSLTYNVDCAFATPEAHSSLKDMLKNLLLKLQALNDQLRDGGHR